MITVVILINGKPIVSRSAVNRGDLPDGRTRYEVEDGSEIRHLRAAGAVPLAIEMLQALRSPV